MTPLATNGPCTNTTFNTSTNRISQIGGSSTGITYDAAGNMTGDGTGTGTYTYTWDAEGRMTSAVPNGGGSTIFYVYNALGQRAEKVTGGTYSEYAFDAFGQALGYHNRTVWTEQLVPAGATPIVKYKDSTTYFLHADRLGSTGTITNASGAETQNILYYPWGQRWAYTGTIKDERFASLGMRDSETANDPTLFRADQARLGRWMSPDPMGGDVTDPQSLNRYAYVMNNPTTLTDPLGLCNIPSSATAESGGGQMQCPGGYDPYSYIGPDGQPHDASNFPQMNADAAAAEAWYKTEYCIGCVTVIYGNSTASYSRQFANLDAYYDWVTDPAGGLPLLTTYQAYQAYMEDCAHATDPCGEGDTLLGRIQGLTTNYRIPGNPLDVSSLNGMLKDPAIFSKYIHGGPSAYSWDFMDPWHVAGYKDQGIYDVESHQDLFNGVLAFPLHFIFDYMPSLFINPKPGVPGSTYTCSPTSGCAPN